MSGVTSAEIWPSNRNAASAVMYAQRPTAAEHSRDNIGTTQSKADRQPACAVGEQRGDCRGISAKRIMSQLLGRRGCVAIIGLSLRSSLNPMKLCSFALILLFHYSHFVCAVPASQLLSPFDTSAMHVCS
ncbi:hypothetical protein CHARACLAT_025727 [Characodon lateralis]|uniref:Uncharacterized protein n=1 Tax=Characodon lateralis TaxID=208331 RepID=A0ABU7DM33_9TELE|nr:hypothetical protein [Characodon lateralis]